MTKSKSCFIFKRCALNMEVCQVGNNMTSAVYPPRRNAWVFSLLNVSKLYISIFLIKRFSYCDKFVALDVLRVHCLSCKNIVCDFGGVRQHFVNCQPVNMIDLLL